MNYNQANLKKDLLQLWWVPLTLVSVKYNWVFYLYAGFSSRSRRLVYCAYIYAIPFALVMIDEGILGYKLAVLTTIGGFIQAILESKSYLRRRYDIKSGKYLEV